ncbi:MAG: hypothetical protein QXY45_00230 [Candidatus Aenigmatarchaeota archaeon]
MRGEISTSTIFYTVLSMILLISLVALFMTQVPKQSENIFEYLRKMLGLGSKNENIQIKYFLNAIKCTEDRCNKGCYNIKDEDYEITDGDYFECKSKFCNLNQWMDSDGKICNFNSYQYPVEINLEGEYQLSEDLINSERTENYRFDCIFLEKGSDYTVADFLYNLIPGALSNIIYRIKSILGNHDKYNLIFLNNTIVGLEGKKDRECIIEGQRTYKNSLKNFKISYIGNTHFYYLSHETSNENYKMIFITPEKGYKKIRFGTLTELEFDDIKEDVKYRINVFGKNKRSADFYLKFNDECLFGTCKYYITVGCKSKEETEEMKIGDSKFFCENKINIFLDDISGLTNKKLKIKIKVSDPLCHTIPINQNSLACDPLCKSCFKNPLNDIYPNMCCYSDEKCIDGVCENYVDPKCHEIDTSKNNCGEYCTPCYVNPRSDLNPKMCCYPNEICELGTCKPQ